MQTALVVKELRSEFAGPFDLNLGAGACAAITGPSGSGKSLFLRMIADLDPNEGKVWLNGTERASIIAPEWRRKVTYVSAESGWWADTVIEHFARNKRGEVGWRPALGFTPIFWMHRSRGYPPARSNAWHWSGRFCCARPSCFWTNRLAHWMRSRSPGSRRCFENEWQAGYRSCW